MTKKSSIYLLILLFIYGSLIHIIGQNVDKNADKGEKMKLTLQSWDQICCVTHGTIFMRDLSGCLNKHSHGFYFLSIETR